MRLETHAGGAYQYGIFLAVIGRMEIRCQRCCGLTYGEAYCVTSEEDGAVMLKMIVCHPCYVEAKRIGLQAQHITNPNLIPNLLDIRMLQ